MASILTPIIAQTAAATIAPQQQVQPAVQRENAQIPNANQLSQISQASAEKSATLRKDDKIRVPQYRPNKRVEGGYSPDAIKRRARRRKQRDDGSEDNSSAEYEQLDLLA